MDRERLKTALLELVNKEMESFQLLLKEYHTKESPTPDEYAKLNAELILSLQRIRDLYQNNNGDDSLFLRNTIKPLFKALDEAQGYADTRDGKQAVAQAKQIQQLSSNQVRLYIVLYQVDSNNLSKWVLQLLSLNSLLATRPVYSQEQDARNACRSNVRGQEKGYVSLIVNKSDIIKDEASAKRKDAQGRSLLLLKQGAIAADSNIDYFMLGKERYQWFNKQLLPSFDER